MNNKAVGIVLGFAVVIAIGGVVYFQNPGASTTGSVGNANNTGGDQSGMTVGVDNRSGNNAGATGDTTPSSNTGGAQTFTMAEVATHNNEASCYSMIDGNVYDLTGWIPQHPGGPSRILSICGIDGSAAFHGQHGNRQQQANILATMKIGALAN